jgi:hypothetical protein
MRHSAAFLLAILAILESRRLALVVEAIVTQQLSHLSTLPSEFTEPKAGLNVRDKTNTKHKDVLVVVMGQLRGSEMAWESLRRHVLKPWAADLAVMTDVSDERNQRSSLLRDAVYKWHEQEHEDWGEVLDRIPGIHPQWRNHLCPMFGFLQNDRPGTPAGQFLGGVLWNQNGTSSRCHRGSSGILLAYRFLVQQRLRELRSTGGVRYKWVVLTRADYLFGCDLPSLDTFKADAYNVPEVEGYGGITDRFSVLPGDLADEILNVPQRVLSDPTLWEKLRVTEARNLEKVLDRYAAHSNITVHKYKHTGFTVKAQGDPGSWSAGSDLAELGEYNLTARYPWEFTTVTWYCGYSSLMDELASIHSRVG